MTTIWILFVFIGNGWGGGDLRKIDEYRSEQLCKDVGKLMYDNIGHVTSFICAPKMEEAKHDPKP